MSWVHVDPSIRACIDPPTGTTAARKDERVRAGFVDYGKLQIAIEWGVGHGLPHENNLRDGII